MPKLDRRSFLTALGVSPIAFLSPAHVMAQAKPVLQKLVVDLAPIPQAGVPAKTPYQVNGQSFGSPVHVSFDSPLHLEVENKLSSPIQFHLQGMALGERTIVPAKDKTIIVFDKWPWGGTFYYRFSTLENKQRTLLGTMGAIAVKDVVLGQFDEDRPLYLDMVPSPIPANLSAPMRSFFAPLQVLGLEGHTLYFKGRQRVRLRLMNTHEWRVMALEFKELDLLCVALDGRAVDVFRPAKNTLILAPFARMDVVFEAPNKDMKVPIFSRTPNGLQPFFEIVIQEQKGFENAPKIGLPGLAQPENLPPQIPLQNALRPKLSLEKGKLKIEGRGDVLEGNKIINAFDAKVGQPVVFALYNGEDAPTTVSLQNATMRLLHPFDDGWEPYWLDTLMAAAGRTVRGAFIPTQAGVYSIFVRTALPEARTFELTYKVNA